MAVTKDQVTFEVDIQVKDNLDSGMRSLSKELESIQKNINSVDKEIKSFEKTLSKDMGKNKGVETIKRDFRQLYFDIQEASKQLKKKSIDIGTTDNFKNLKAINKELSMTSESIDEVVISTKDLEEENESLLATYASIAGAVVTFAESSKLLRQSLGEKDLENYVRRINAFNSALGTATSTVLKSSDVLRGFSVGTITTADKSFKALSRAIVATSSDLRPFSLSFIEFLTVASPLLTQFGLALQFSESGAGQMTGTLLILAGVLSGAFTSAIAFALREVGSFTQSIGEGLINVLEEFDTKATKAETVTRQFTFVLQNFADTLSKKTVGSLQEWNKTLDQIDDTTNFTTQSIQKSIKLLISEGTALGLTFQDNQRLLRESTDIAAATGKDLEAVTQALLSGLAGQSQAAFALGINLRESALLHDINSHAVENNTKKLSENEKLQKRLNIITKRANILEGASQSLANTREGQLIRYNKALSELQENLGSTNILVTEFNNAQILTINALNTLPKSVFKVISAFGQLAGVFLIVTGFLIKWGLLISGLLTLFKALAAIVSANVIVQNALTVAVNRANAALGLQAVQVTSLTTLFTSLKSIIIAFGTTGLAAIFSKIAAVLASAAAAVATFLVAIAPLLIKIGLIVGVAIAFWKAIQDLGKELMAIKTSISALLLPFTELLILMGLLDSQGKATLNILDEIDAAFTKIVDTLKLVILGLTKIITTASLLGTSFFADLQQVFGASDESIKRTNESIFDLEASLGKIDEKIGSVVLSFGETKEETEKVAENIQKIKDEIDQTSLESLINQVTNLRDVNNDLKNEIRGIGLNQVEQIELARDIELEKLSILEKELIAAGELSKFSKEIADARGLQAQRASLKIELLRADAAKAIADANESIRKEQALVGLEGKELANAKLDQALKEVDLMEQQLRDQGLLTAEAQKQLDIRRQLIAQSFVPQPPPDDTQEKGDILADIQGAVSASFAAGADIYASVVDLATNDMALSLQKSTDMMIMGLANVADNAGAIIMNALNAFDAVVNALPGIIQNFMAQLPMIIDRAVVSIINFLDKLPAMVSSIMEKLPELIAQVFDKLPSIIEKFLEVVPQVITMIISKIPLIITNIIDRLPEILAALIEGFIGAMGEIVGALIDTFISKGGAFRIAESIVKAFIKLIPLMINAFVKGLSRAIKGIFSGFSVPLPDLKPLEKSVSNIFNKVVSGATKVSEEVFSVIDIPGAQRGLDDPEKAVEKVQEVLNQSITKVAGLWESFLAALKKAWMWVWDNILSPIAEVIKMAWMFVYNTIIKPIVGVIKKAFGFVVNLFKNYPKIVKKAFDTVITFFKNMAVYIQTAFAFVVNFFRSYSQIVSAAFEGVIGFFRNYAAIVNEAFKTVINFFQHIFKGEINEAFAEVFDFFRKLPELLENLGKPLQEAYNKSFGIFVEFMQKNLVPLMQAAIKPWSDLFKGIQDVFKQAIKPFEDFFKVENLGKKFGDILKKAFEISPIGMLFKVDEIRNIFQKALNFNPASLLSKMFGLGDGLGRQGTVEKLVGIDVPFVQFAKGGPIPGPMGSTDSLRNDTIPALLSPGEYVLPRSVMSIPGVVKIVEALMRGELPQMFGLGGVVKKLSKGDVGGAFQEAGETGKQAFKDFEQTIKNMGIPDPMAEVRSQVAKAIKTMMQNTVGFNEGGPVSGGFGNDNALARLTDGEFVFAKPAVDRIGSANLSRLNSGGSIGETKIELNFGAGSIQLGADANAEEFVDELVEALRRRSLDGDFVMAVDGLRTA